MEQINYNDIRPTGFDSRANFIGDLSEFDGCGMVLARHRDSDARARSNFAVAVDMLGGESDDVRIIRHGHWACGWVEYLIVRLGTPAETIGEDILCGLTDYPVLDDEHLSALEHAEAADVWTYFTWRDRAEHIRKYRSCFEFRNYADLIGCVRGQWYSGDPSLLVE